jgi:uncharacterized protein YPO0396
MKTLKTIKLINWHLFENATLSLKGNTLVTGQNGSGKTTLLDAVQYVMTAGHTKFNVAALANTKRTLETYIRGKTGIEGKKYLRSDSVTTHIALEFLDDVTQAPTVLGVVIDLSPEDRKRERFYLIKEGAIKESYFIDDKQIRDGKSFIAHLKAHVSVKDFDTKKAFKPVILSVFGLLHPQKYFDLIPKALAFKPIDDVNRFVYDFLLNENKIEIDTLRNNIREFQEIEKMIEKEEIKKTDLTKVIKTHDNYQKSLAFQRLYQTVDRLNRQYETHTQKDRLEKRVLETEHALNARKKEAKAREHQIERDQDERNELKIALNNNESYRMIENMKQKLAGVTRRYTELKASTDADYAKILVEKKRYGSLRPYLDEPVSFDLDRKHISTDQLTAIFSSLKPLYAKLEDEKTDLLYGFRRDLTMQEDERKKTRHVLKALSERTRIYPKAMDKLKTDLEKRYEERFGQKPRMLRPLCELIEVQNEAMRHVIEGFLADYRFFLVPDADESNRMHTIFTEIKDKSPYEGIGLIDYDTLSQNKALIHLKTDLVTTNDTTAQRFCNRMFKDMVVVEKHTDVLNRPNAVTKDTLLHHNDTVHMIDPATYLMPYIGEKAIDIQVAHYQRLEKDLVGQIQTLEEHISETEKILHLVKPNILQYLSGRVESFDQLNALIKEKNALERELKELAKDDTWIHLEEKLKTLEKTIETAKNEKRTVDEAILNTQSTLEVEKERLKNVTERLESLNEDVTQLKQENPEGFDEATEKLQKYLSESTSHERINELANRYIRDYQVETENNMLELEGLMVRFNSDHHFDAPTGIKHIGIYREELIKVETRELAKYRDKSRIAKEKCETSFQEDFISKLRQYIDHAYQEIERLNQALKDKRFGKDTYKFVITRSKNRSFGDYHDIIRSGEDFHADTLFTENISDKNRLVMKDLFDMLTAHADATQQEQELEKYTDYRSYMSYDIRITDSDGNQTNFSNVYKEKSGGETQTPFYVIIASSFDQLIGKRKQTRSGCLVLFDEAFNNMDEARIEAMMTFYSELNIQLIISVPPQRFANIQPYVETTVTVVKQKNRAHAKSFNAAREPL